MNYSHVLDRVCTSESKCPPPIPGGLTLRLCKLHADFWDRGRTVDGKRCYTLRKSEIEYQATQEVQP